MSSLPAPLRKQLENAVKAARQIAEQGARKALEALAVHEADPYRHMSEGQRTLRRRLRAQARQLGDSESTRRPGTYDIHHLAEKLAYDQWHRMLFARYLLENQLLISPEHQVAVSLSDCEELAPSLGLKDAWAVAAQFASRELPEIFRADDPTGLVELPVEDRKPLIQLVIGLPVAVFTVGDSLGWTYQFWQADRKEQVNKSGTKIGADELPAVTQLFTEDYMVDFLLDNTLGAWWAGKVLAANPRLAAEAKSEVELREAVELPGCPWTYLRFTQQQAAVAVDKVEAASSRFSLEALSSDAASTPKEAKRQDAATTFWTPAAGTFEGWPKSASGIRTLDPCMGSGHFVVALFERLVALRIAEEKLKEVDAVMAVIRDNLFGLEIDPRCTQIAAFNLALAAWRRVGHCQLPAMNLACSGLAPNALEADWLAIAGDNQKLQRGMERLYRLFKNAPVLGSLINPRAEEGDLLVASFQELQPLLEMALGQESKTGTTTEALAKVEMGVTARGLAKAAEILAGQFTLVATNVPYLLARKQCSTLKEWCESYHTAAKADLATAFVQRGFTFAATGGTVAYVTPQNWLYLGTSKKLREALLKDVSWNVVARLGPEAFETIGGEVVNVALLAITKKRPTVVAQLIGLDATEQESTSGKGATLYGQPLRTIPQYAQLENPDARILVGDISQLPLLEKYSIALNGMHGGDTQRFRFFFWEIGDWQTWTAFQGTCESTMPYSGREHVFFWPEDGKIHHENPQAFVKGYAAWGRRGVVVNMMGQLPASLYSGEKFDISCTPIIPHNADHLLAIWAFCSSLTFRLSVRQIDQSLKVTNATLAKVPFDLAHWQKVAAAKYPNGLPKPFSSDPTQWLFDGNVARASRSGVPENPDRDGLATLQVAVARLLGYQWPRQTGSSFPDCPALGPDGLESMADGDGIVCLSATKGEAPAAERLRELLARAFGKEWNASLQEELLAQCGFPGGSLEDWLRNGFFEQHCAHFHQRPFIWHIWDGLKNGFGALVNYHKLTHAGLENLTFAYLNDWIRRQQTAVAAGEAGSDARLQAAKELQARLKLILEGEPPYDLFVRWKPLSQQAIGWHPDLNDGVRMNIRPFVMADVLRKKVKVKWEKDRGNEPRREKADYPWFWGWDEEKQDFLGGREFTGERWNDCHYSNEVKRRARK